jgi:transcriptional regulator with XRE-family HTH domain
VKAFEKSWKAAGRPITSRRKVDPHDGGPRPAPHGGADEAVRRAAEREARAKANGALLSPLIIRAIREGCRLTQREAARVFGGGPKAFEKYEAGKTVPGASMTRLLLLALRRPYLFQKGTGGVEISAADTELIREALRQSSVGWVYEAIYGASA